MQYTSLSLLLEILEKVVKEAQDGTLTQAILYSLVLADGSAKNSAARGKCIRSACTLGSCGMYDLTTSRSRNLLEPTSRILKPTAIPDNHSQTQYNHNMSSPEPKKYVKVNGIMKLNPEYKKWKESNGQVASTVPNTAQALPVVTTMADYEALNQAVVIAGDVVPVAWAESTTATMEMLRENDICVAAGMTPDTMLNRLQTMFDKYEVPIGLINKLLVLSEFESLEFLIDDSGSMVCA